MIYRYRDKSSEENKLPNTESPGSRYDLSQPHLRQEVGNPLESRGEHIYTCEFGLEDFWSDSVESQAKIHKQDPCVYPWAAKIFVDVVQPYLDSILH